MIRLASTLSLLQRIGIFTAVGGIAGLLLAMRFSLDAAIPFSILALLVAALCFSLESILKREETVSRGDGTTNSYVYGFQAVAMGFANVVLVLAALTAVFAWLLGSGRELAVWAGDNPGAPMAVAGLWLAVSQIGVVVGVALSTLDASDDTMADRALNMLNMLMEKFIAVVLSLAGLALLFLGGLALLRGWGLEDMLGLLP